MSEIKVLDHYKHKSHCMWLLAQIIIEFGCLDICNRNMRKFMVKYNQMECSCNANVHPVLGIKCTILDCWLFDCI